MAMSSFESNDAAADLAVCARLLANGSRTFHRASRLLPRELADAATAVYAFCRVADDAVDAGRGGRRVQRLKERLARVYAHCPEPHAADRALARVVDQYALPRAIPEMLLEGFEWDVAGKRYETLAELHEYALRVAGTVGMMMAWLMGVRAAPLLARACELGMAMQLTNIARDVGEDARAGRLYLPLAWLRGAGIDAERWLGAPEPSEALARVVARLLEHADSLYERGDAGLNRLPLRFRAGIRAARLLYAEIGHELARGGCDSVSRRTRVPNGRALALLLRAPLPLRSRFDATAAPLPAAAALVAACAVPESSPQGVETGLGAGLVRTIEMFAALERRERELATRPRSAPRSA